MKKFEYKVLTTSMQMLSVQTLNELGSDSWELISTQQIGMGMHYFFKREKGKSK